jgi:hypothetical protein
MWCAYQARLEAADLAALSENTKAPKWHQDVIFFALATGALGWERMADEVPWNLPE